MAARKAKKKKKSAIRKIAEARGITLSAAKLRLLKSLKCTLDFERQAWASGARAVAGVDEVGRGALFGPVVAAAVILPNHDKFRGKLRGLRDSKLLDEEQREKLAARVKEIAVCYSVASVDVARIDQLNIYHATRLAMYEAVRKLPEAPDYLLIDAMRLDLECAQTKIIHGDALSVSIAAASVIAKVERDGMMREWDAVYPQFGLAGNKGYSTPKHKQVLREIGPTPLHRMSFAPVWLANDEQAVLGFMETEDATAQEE